MTSITSFFFFSFQTLLDVREVVEEEEDVAAVNILLLLLAAGLGVLLADFLRRTGGGDPSGRLTWMRKSCPLSSLCLPYHRDSPDGEKEEDDGEDVATSTAASRILATWLIECNLLLRTFPCSCTFPCSSLWRHFCSEE